MNELLKKKSVKIIVLIILILIALLLLGLIFKDDITNYINNKNNNNNNNITENNNPIDDNNTIVDNTNNDNTNTDNSNNNSNSITNNNNNNNNSNSNNNSNNSSNNSQQDVGKISFEKNSYACSVGTTFETIITALNDDGTAIVKSYSSSNTSIASIDEEVEMVPKCINCKAIRVVCNKQGNVTLNATSTTGANTSASLTVNTDKGKINFENNNYSCKVGETFETIITATNDSNTAMVESYSSSNTSIAKVDDIVKMIPKCINCKAIRVQCLKEGNVTLSATSTTGITGNSSLSISK